MTARHDARNVGRLSQTGMTRKHPQAPDGAAGTAPGASQTAAKASSTPPGAAKRGDLVVIEEHHRDLVLRGESSEYDTFTVGVVTSVTRDGHVKMYRRAGEFDQGKDWRGQPDRGEPVPPRMARAYLMSSKAVDVAGALATAACHVWDTGVTKDGHTKPYDSLAEIKAALRPHLRTGQRGVWERLHAAAARWELMRRAAAPMLTAALRAPRVQFAELDSAYQQAVIAANNAYRAEYAAAACGVITGMRDSEVGEPEPESGLASIPGRGIRPRLGRVRYR